MQAAAPVALSAAVAHLNHPVAASPGGALQPRRSAGAGDAGALKGNDPPACHWLIALLGVGEGLLQGSIKGG